MSQNPSPPAPASRGLGMPFLALVGLALLGVPRVILHDTGALTEGTPLNALFVFLPPVVWIAVALWRRVPNAFLTILVIGAIYGVLLALTHQALWHVAFDGHPPRLGGNLADLDPGAQGVILRSFAIMSSVFTGVIVGAVTGLVAWGIQALTRGARR